MHPDGRVTWSDPVTYAGTSLLTFSAVATDWSSGDVLEVGYSVSGGGDSPYLWVDVKGDSWKFFDKLLTEANVVTTPGAGFGRDGQGYIRISAFNSRANVEEAIARLAKVLA